MTFLSLRGFFKKGFSFPKWSLFVGRPRKGKSPVVAVRFPPLLLKMVKEEAKRRGKTFSQFVREAVMEKLIQVGPPSSKEGGGEV